MKLNLFIHIYIDQSESKNDVLRYFQIYSTPL